MRTALECAATNPKSVVQVLDLAAKLNREIGHQADGRSGDTHFRIHTNVNIWRSGPPRIGRCSRRRSRFRSRLTA